MSVKPLKQLKINLAEGTAQDGDCYRTCIAMLLGEDSPDKVPDFTDSDIIYGSGWPKAPDHLIFSGLAMNEWLTMNKGCKLEQKPCEFENCAGTLEAIIQASRDEYRMPVMINISVAIGDELNFSTIRSSSDPTKLFDHSIIIDASQEGKTFLYDPDPSFEGEWEDKKKIKELFPSENMKLPHKRGYLPISGTDFKIILIGHIRPIPESQLNEKRKMCKELCDSFRQNPSEESFFSLKKSEINPLSKLFSNIPSSSFLPPNMNWKIKETVKQIRYQISQGNRFPEGSRLDLTSVPKDQEQDWRNAIEEVFKEFNIPCPPINFVPAIQQSKMNNKIDTIMAGIADQTKNGKEIEIRLDFEGNDQFVTSLPPILTNRMRAELGYAFINGSSENIFDNNGRQVAIAMKFEPA